MKHLDGMTTAERIRQMDADVILIFITNMAQYAIRGYSVGALDYVLKPVPTLPFAAAAQGGCRLEKRAKHYLTVPVEGGLRRLDTASIYYLESEGHRVHFYTDEAIFPPPAPSRPLRKSWQTAPLPAATAAILSIWHRCGSCGRAPCRWAPASCRSAAPSVRLFLPH